MKGPTTHDILREVYPQLPEDDILRLTDILKPAQNYLEAPFHTFEHETGFWPDYRNWLIRTACEQYLTESEDLLFVCIVLGINSVTP